MQRPSLESLPEEVRSYILYLENELEKFNKPKTAPLADRNVEPELEPLELPTLYTILTGSGSGLMKKTPRHIYQRQRRGGMGVFDIELPDDQMPIILSHMHQEQKALILTSFGRAFHLNLQKLPESQIRERGSLVSHHILPLEPTEEVTSILPNPSQGYLNLLTLSGYVRRFRHHIFGDYLKPGSSLVDVREHGRLISACGSNGDQDIFIASRRGIGIRFSEKSIPPNGCLGLRLSADDEAISIAAVDDKSVVFLMSAEGMGTRRLMSGFSANKSPGTGGKIAMKTDSLIGAVTVSDTGDLFAISRLSKIIRFKAAEVPAKDSVVQGVICMSLRSDDCVALAAAEIEA